MNSKYTQYIELVGVAGVGKTTVAKLLVDEGEKIGISIKLREVIKKNVWLRFYIICEIIKIIITAPEILFLYLIPIREDYTNTSYVKEVKKNLITRMVIDVGVINYFLKNTTKFIVNDEGVIGKLISLAVISKLSMLKVNKLIKKLLPNSTILIYVKTSPLVALQRENKRKINLPFFDEMEPGLKKSFYDKAIQNYTKLSENIKFVTPVNEIFIKNSGDYDELKQKVGNVARKIKEDFTRNF